MPPLQLRDYSNKRRVLANVHLELAPGFTLEMRFPVTHGFTSDHSAARAADVAGECSNVFAAICIFQNLPAITERDQRTTYARVRSPAFRNSPEVSRV